MAIRFKNFTLQLACALAPIVLFFQSPIAAQEKCATAIQAAHWIQQRPELQAIHQQGEVQAKAFENKIKSGSLVPPPLITVPVVVHVVYHDSTEKISYAQIQSQMEALNRDYRKINPDTTAIPAPWKSIAADIGFEFCLATKDPSGRDTSGVTYTYTSATSFNPDESVKDSAPAWDATRYLNIWVCNLGDSYYGYSQFPYDLRIMPTTDGCVINYFAFGQMGSAQAPSNLGRTCTHEVGHWFNLIHTWGDAYCGDDSIADTPAQTQAHYGCTVTFPDLTTACDPTSEPNGTMYCNYMDYSDDPCLLMFTADQKIRMLSALYAYRPLILQQNSCTPLFAEVPEIAAGQSTNSKLSVYPNPAVQTLTLQWTSQEVVKLIECTNMCGQVVKRFSFENETAPVSTYTLDISNLPAGAYLVNAVGTTGNYRQKWIKTISGY